MTKRSFIACIAMLSACALSACAAPTTARPGKATPQEASVDLSTRRAATWFAIETSLGADCSQALASPYGHRGFCTGPAPEHIRSFFRVIVSNLPSNERDAATDAFAKPVYYKAIPGAGERADFIVEWPISEGRTATIRSLESAEPGTTTYITNLGCEDAPSDSNVCDAGTRMRAYRLVAGSEPEDATRAVFPAKPALSADERTHYDRLGVGEIGLDISRLHLTSTMRWTAEADPDAKIPGVDPRAFAEGWEAHFGFLVWNGTRYELREKVPSALWPCPPYRTQAGEVEDCRPADKRRQDPFVAH